jgi:hypothetical protein
MIDDVFRVVQVLDAFMISVFGSDLTYLHQVIPIYREGIIKAVKVPVLKQG